MSFSRGEVVLLPIPFTDLTSRKVRPAVVIGHFSFIQNTRSARTVAPFAGY
jgi:hypothetical protein